MKIAVITAGGRIGSLTTDEAVERGHDVTAFVRSDRSTRAQHTVVKDAREISADDLAGFDAVVDAFGAWVPEELDQHDEVTKALADAVAGTSTKLYVVGSAGTMLMGGDPAKPLRDSEIMLEEYKPLAKAMGKAFDNLCERDDVNWVCVTRRSISAPMARGPANTPSRVMRTQPTRTVFPRCPIQTTSSACWTLSRATSSPSVGSRCTQNNCRQARERMIPMVSCSTL